MKCKEQSLEPRALQGRGSRYSTYICILYIPKVANNNSLQHPTGRRIDQVRSSSRRRSIFRSLSRYPVLDPMLNTKVTKLARSFLEYNGTCCSGKVRTN